MAYKGKKILDLPVDSGVEKLLGTDASGEVKLIDKNDVGSGAGECGVFTLQAYGTLDIAYKQMTVDRIEGKWSELVAAVEAGKKIVLYANDTVRGSIYVFDGQQAYKYLSDSIEEVVVGLLGLINSDPPEVALTYAELNEGENDSIVSESGDYVLDTLEAKNVPITDAGGYFMGGTVETALQELGAKGDGIFTIHAYGALDIPYEQITIDRIEGKWSDLVAAIEGNEKISMRMHQMFRPVGGEEAERMSYDSKYTYTYFSNEGDVSYVRFLLLVNVGHNSLTSMVVCCVDVEEGDDDSIVVESNFLNVFKAQHVPITDSGSHFTATDAEGALQELAANVNELRARNEVVFVSFDPTMEQPSLNAHQIHAAWLSGKTVILRLDVAESSCDALLTRSEIEYALFSKCETTRQGGHFGHGLITTYYLTDTYDGEGGWTTSLDYDECDIGSLEELKTTHKNELVWAINELVDKNTALEARVAALEGGNT